MSTDARVQIEMIGTKKCTCYNKSRNRRYIAYLKRSIEEKKELIKQLEDNEQDIEQDIREILYHVAPLNSQIRKIKNNMHFYLKHKSYLVEFERQISDLETKIADRNTVVKERKDNISDIRFSLNINFKFNSNFYSSLVIKI